MFSLGFTSNVRNTQAIENHKYENNLLIDMVIHERNVIIKYF